LRNHATRRSGSRAFRTFLEARSEVKKTALVIWRTGAPLPFSETSLRAISTIIAHPQGFIYFQLRTAAFKAYCAIWVRRSKFRHQASPRVSPREITQRRRVELWARNVREFCLNADLHFTFRDLLHAVKLRHGTSSPKEGVLRIFSP
jgi:hypothetical protein